MILDYSTILRRPDAFLSSIRRIHATDLWIISCRVSLLHLLHVIVWHEVIDVGVRVFAAGFADV